MIQKPVQNNDVRKQTELAANPKSFEILEETRGNLDQSALVAEDEEKKVQQLEKFNVLGLQEVCDNFRKEGVPAFWIDRFKMQNAYSLEAKGWKVQVNWKESSITGAGVGVFVGEDVEKGQLIREAITGKNLIRLRNKSDLPKNPSSVTKNYFTNYCSQVDDFTYIYLPGNCKNHSTDPNTILKVADEETLHLVACKDMKAGMELTGDYYACGEPPKYLTDFAAIHKIDLLFSGYNSFM